MQKEFTPSVEWLEAHKEDPEAVKKYLFDFLQARVYSFEIFTAVGKYWLKRDSLRKKPCPPLEWLEERATVKDVILEYLPDFLLSEVYSPMVLATAKEHWDELPFYVTESLDPKITNLIHNPVPDMQKAINRYWIERAVRVLNGYADCPIPLSKDKRVTGLRRDLLSEKGHERLHLLEHALEQNHVTDILATLARSSAQKAGLELDLFLDVSHLIPVVQNKKPYTKETYKMFQVSMSSGCYNGCVHCGHDAKAPVSHMPYPIFLKLFKIIYEHNSGNTDFFIYSDSDPITYCDPIINADSGDVAKTLSSLKRNVDNPIVSFLTKGVLSKRDEIAFGKVVHNVKLNIESSRSLPFSICLSFVDLPGEPVTHNIKRIRRTAEIFNSITNQELHLRHYHVQGQNQIDLGFLSFFGSLYLQTEINPVGRWAQTLRKLAAEKNIPYEPPKPISRFAPDYFNIGADLTLYNIYLDGERHVWQPLCSVLDRDFMAQLVNPKQIHPTIANAIYVTKDKKPLTFVGRLHKLLHRGSDD